MTNKETFTLLFWAPEATIGRDVEIEVEVGEDWIASDIEDEVGEAMRYWMSCEGYDFDEVDWEYSQEAKDKIERLALPHSDFFSSMLP